MTQLVFGVALTQLEFLRHDCEQNPELRQELADEVGGEVILQEYLQSGKLSKGEYPRTFEDAVSEHQWLKEYGSLCCFRIDGGDRMVIGELLQVGTGISARQLSEKLNQLTPRLAQIGLHQEAKLYVHLDE